MKEQEEFNYTHLVPLSSNYRLLDFKSSRQEYNEFLIKEAIQMQNIGVSNTQLLLNNTNGDIIAYFSLCMASVRLKNEEKESHNLSDVCFNSIPAVKIGKLAVDEKYLKRGFGSYMINLIIGISASINSLYGVGCRFIVVDVDISENNNELIEFYKKNGFKYNDSYKSNNTTISMRFDILL